MIRVGKGRTMDAVVKENFASVWNLFQCCLFVTLTCRIA